VWIIKGGQPVLTVERHTCPVTGVAFSPDGARIASAAGDGKVKVHDAATGREIFTGMGDSWMTDVTFSPDGRHLATGDADGIVRVWDAGTGRQLRTFPHPREVKAVAYSPDSQRIATAGADGMVRVWSTALESESLAVPGQEIMAFAPDGRHFATVGVGLMWAGTQVKIHDVSTGRVTRVLKGHTDWVFGVAYSPDGARVASAGRDGTVRVWDVATGREAAALRGHSSQVFRVAYSPDGAHLASSGFRGTPERPGPDAEVKTWDVKTGRALQTFPVDKAAVGNNLNVVSPFV
jgi:WD40 repeat protein